MTGARFLFENVYAKEQYRVTTSIKMTRIWPMLDLEAWPISEETAKVVHVKD